MSDALQTAGLAAAPLGAGRLARFAAKAAERHGVVLNDYWQLHEWSISEPEQFWAEVWQQFGVVTSAPYRSVLDRRTMPGAKWFQGARLNYVDQVMRFDDRPGAAVVSIAEDGSRSELSWPQLRAAVASFTSALRSMGIEPGDRVVGYLPNAQESVIAFLATASLGATWAGCAPDYGVSAAADRLQQLEPTVLVAATAYCFDGKLRDRREEVAALVERLGVRAVVTVPRAGLDAEPAAYGSVRHERWNDVCSADSAEQLTTAQVPAEHPLWVLFSSGTTGLPKGIVHSHAGVVAMNLAASALQVDMGPGDTFFWYTTTNWMLWNSVVSSLLSGVTAVTYEGSPFFPTADRLWQIVADERVTVFGTSPGHILGCASQGLRPNEHHRFPHLKQVMVSGAPAPASVYEWVADTVSPSIPLISSSGGTDVVGAFVSGAPPLPVVPGEISGPVLGTAVAAFDSNGEPIRDEVGELVVTLPMPSMPVRFWNDPDGSKYRSAYFDTFPGVWRHGDWVTHTSSGSFVVHGRSDSTLNRNGVRIGSADLYQIVEGPGGVAEAMVIGVERTNGTYRMPMFLVPHAGQVLDDEAIGSLRQKLRTEGSPRHVPDEFHVVAAIPHTKTGKKLEVPIKRILQGARAEEVLSEGAIDRPELIAYYITLAGQWDAEDAHAPKDQ
ncbi:acetoacetate--CoA ligase [Nonomuraea lactucae]|uniref:acetoacetate--CoA ligase n=1 Tax=Nonomuraea lactucae TaxID=2249762 RepID=UPI000DE3E632|nr:acetoacetate--CoA ligase [Nonomuraea lactucae]